MTFTITVAENGYLLECNEDAAAFRSVYEGGKMPARMMEEILSDLEQAIETNDRVRVTINVERL